MSNCNEIPNCLPCNPCTTCDPCGPDYTDTGCCDFVKTDCVVYKGDSIACLNISTNENLTQILVHLQDIICALTPTGYGAFDYGCFASQNITTEQQFVEFVSSVLCQVLGSQVPGGITSLSTLNALIAALTVDVNLIKNQTLISCFQTLSGLTTPQTISVLLTAVQTILCDHESRLDALEGGSVNTPITVINFEKNVNIDASGLNNHTLTANVVLDQDASNALTTSNVGLKCISPAVSVVDTQSINFSTSGTLNHTITGDVKISATAGNAASILADGIYVNSAASSETPLVATDSSSLNFAQSGVNGHTFTGDIILDPSLLNIAQITVNGLLVSSASIQDPITPTDTQSIDLTVTGATGHTLRADAVISPTAGNNLQLLANGLYVNAVASSTNSWNILGNAGTVDGVNFVGTTDNNPLNLRVNNQPSGKIKSNGITLYGYQAGLNNTNVKTQAFGYQALKSNITGGDNVAFGGGALYSCVGTGHNVAFGNSALYTLAGSTFPTANVGRNSAFGSRALYNFPDGDECTAVGYESLYYNGGSGNSAFGANSGTPVTAFQVLTGTNNLFLGKDTQYISAAINKSVAIGVGAKIKYSNNITLGGTGADAVSVVIGDDGADPSAVLEIKSITQGFLPPRMTTTQKNAIATPPEGLIVYDITLHKLYCYDATVWQAAW